MMHKLLVLLFAAICSFFHLSASDDDECLDVLLEPKSSEPLLGAVEVGGNQQSSLTNLESEPSATIFNCVSVISGDYTDATTDYIVPGPDPLPIQRVFSSGEHVGGSVGHGTFWGKFGILLRSKVETRENGKETQAQIVGSGGSRMTYLEVGDKDYKLHKKSFQKGLTNTSAGIISGRTNPLNDRLVSDPKKKLVHI